MKIPEKEKQKAFIAAVEDERQYILSESEPEYFIEEYCQIESKDELGVSVIPFKMWPE